MKLLRKRGQSIGEYAILLGIVLGAVFAVQQYIRARIVGGIKAEADSYLDAINKDQTIVVTDAVGQVSDSTQRSEIAFTTVEKGTALSRSRGLTTTTSIDKDGNPIP